MSLRDAQARPAQVAAMGLAGGDVPAGRLVLSDFEQGAVGRREHSVLVPVRAGHGADDDHDSTQQPADHDVSHVGGIVARRG